MAEVLYGIVRTKEGKPKFDDPETVPQAVKGALTDKDISLLSDGELKALGLMHRKPK